MCEKYWNIFEESKRYIYLKWLNDDFISQSANFFSYAFPFLTLYDFDEK